MKGINKLLAVPALALGLTACDPLDTPEIRACKEQNLLTNNSEITWGSDGFRKQMKELGIQDIIWGFNIDNQDQGNTLTVSMRNNNKITFKSPVTPEMLFRDIQTEGDKVEARALKIIRENVDRITPYICQ